MTEDDARRIALSVLTDRFPEFQKGNWIIAAVTEYPTAWAFEYNSRAYIETRAILHALAGNGALIVPKSGAAPWFAGSGADTESQVAQGRRPPGDQNLL